MRRVLEGGGCTGTLCSVLGGVPPGSSGSLQSPRSLGPCALPTCDSKDGQRMRRQTGPGASPLTPMWCFHACILRLWQCPTAPRLAGQLKPTPPLVSSPCPSPLLSCLSTPAISHSPYFFTTWLRSHFICAVIYQEYIELVAPDPELEGQYVAGVRKRCLVSKERGNHLHQ